VSDLGLRPFNARSLVLSVLLGLPRPRLSSAATGRLADAFGIARGTMRTALSRMVAAGELVAVDGGYELRGERLLARKRAQDIGRRPATGGWDGSWLVVTAVAPSRALAARRDFRAAMANARLAELRPDTWMRPANLPAPPEFDGVLAVRGAVHGVGDRELVAALWDLDALADRGTELLAALDGAWAALRARDARTLAATLPVAAAVVRFLREEPLLPAQLTPARWPPDDLRRRYAGFDRDLGRALAITLR
jgi:phenylacetic acid degradation operon negative regulatory protein